MNDLENMIKGGYVKKNKHPFEELYILNYTSKTQYESFWNETTQTCRGLIVDKDNNIVSRCFRKFFNYSEVKDQANNYLSNNSYSVYEKVDGSLGISYFVKNKPYISTRGSFESCQAKKATQILSNKKIKLDQKLTYLFEIVYPENTIVVNYGKKEDLILIGVIETETGKEIDIHENFFGFNVCEKIYCDSIENLDKNKSNFEGYVVKFEDGFRFKIKLEDYVRLHKLLFGLSSREIWSCLRAGTELDLSNVPDEIFSWIKSTKNSIVEKYNHIEFSCQDTFRNIKYQNRKEFAEKALKHEYSGILFKILDNRPYNNILWDFVKPDYYTYRTENE